MAIAPKYADIVTNAARWAGGIGVPGSVFPPLDIAAMSFIWIKMTRDISQRSGHKVNWYFASKLIYAISAGSLLYIGGSKLINALLHAIPGVGTVTAAGANAIFNYVYTNRLGNMLIAQFEKPTFDKESLFSMATNIATAVFVDVTADEVAEATSGLGDSLETTSSADVSLSDTSDAMAAPASEVPIVTDSTPFTHHGQPLFTGLAGTQTIAGLQVGPECGIHAVGNMIQLDNPGIGEGINDAIRNAEWAHGGLVASVDGLRLDTAHYEHIVEGYYNIPVHWERFDPLRIDAFLGSDHGILVVGDAQYLLPGAGPQSWHAFNIVDRVTDTAGRNMYACLDSNAPGKVVLWPVENVHAAVNSFPINGANALITDRPVRWPHKT